MTQLAIGFRYIGALHNVSATSILMMLFGVSVIAYSEMDVPDADMSIDVVMLRDL